MLAQIGGLSPQNLQLALIMLALLTSLLFLNPKPQSILLLQIVSHATKCLFLPLYPAPQIKLRQTLSISSQIDLGSNTDCHTDRKSLLNRFC